MDASPQPDRKVGVNTGIAPVFPATEQPADRPRRWWVDCRDAQHSRRVLSVLANRDRVVLVGPPGETVVLPTAGAGALGTALRKAADQARK